MKIKNDSTGTRLPSSRFSPVVITNATLIGKEGGGHPRKSNWCCKSPSYLSKKAHKDDKHLYSLVTIGTYPQRIAQVVDKFDRSNTRYRVRIEGKGPGARP